MSTLWNSRCGFFIGMVLPPYSSPEHRQRADAVAMLDFAPLHRILELNLENIRRPHAALGRQRAAEHQRAFGETGLAGEFFDQLQRIEHRGHRTFLIKHALAVLGNVGAQHQLVPMRRYLDHRTEFRRDRLVAHLLRHRDAVFLHLTVGMVGTGADPQPAVLLQEHELTLPARCLAEPLDAVGEGQPRRRGAIEDRRRRRRFYAERTEFLDVQLDGGAVAPGPAGHHEVFNRDVASRQPGIVVKQKRKYARRHWTSPPVALNLDALYRRGKATQSSDREAREEPQPSIAAAGPSLLIALQRMRAMHEITGQVHWHEPSGFKRAGFGKFNRPKTPYDLFMEADDIPVYRDIGVSKVQNLPLQPWKRMGGRGSYIQLHGTEGKWGAYVVEVPGAGALNPEKHMYEEVYLAVEGRGSTEVWLEGDNKRHVFEWQKGSLVSVPGNAMHRIAHASSAPALLLGGTTAPNLMNLINNTDVIFNCPYQFRDRFSGADDFYKYKDDIEPDPVRGLAMRRTNFVPDVIHCDLPLDNRRSPGWRRVEPFMTGNTFYLWIGQHENGRYSKAHAHTSAAVLICLTGKGYTYTWPERYGVNPWKDGHGDKVKRVDYEPFGMVSAAPGGARWYHQHFGASKDAFRLTAWFGPHNPGREPGPPGEKHTDYTAMDIPEGGTAIPYYMEDPFLRRQYAETMKREGAENRMRPEYYERDYRGLLPKE